MMLGVPLREDASEKAARCVCVCFPPRTFTFSQAAQALGASNLVWQAGEPPETLLCWSGCLVIDSS